MDHEKLLFYVLIMLFGIGLYVPLQGYMIALDTSGWTFAGASFVASIIPILPILWLLAVTLVPTYFIVENAA